MFSCFSLHLGAKNGLSAGAVTASEVASLGHEVWNDAVEQAVLESELGPRRR